jgi:hypothetical protein
MYNERMTKTRVTYIAFRSNPANDHITDGMWCSQNFVPVEELRTIKASPDVAVEVLEKRRTLYAGELAEIDRALIERAKSGDYKAAELIYRRFENWTPKQAEAELKKSPGQKTFADLIAEEDV